MLFLFDVDEVCNKFVSHLLGHLQLSGCRVPDIEEITSFKLSNHLDDDVWRTAKSVMEDVLFWKEIPPNQPVVDLIRYLQQQPLTDVVFVTSPWVSCAWWAYARHKWLEATFGVSFQNIVITSRKNLVLGDVFVDDRAQNVIKWFGLHPYKKAVILDRPWNRFTEHADVLRFTDEELVDWCRALIID